MLMLDSANHKSRISPIFVCACIIGIVVAAKIPPAQPAEFKPIRIIGQNRLINLAQNIAQSGTYTRIPEKTQVNYNNFSMTVTNSSNEKTVIRKNDGNFASIYYGLIWAGEYLYSAYDMQGRVPKDPVVEISSKEANNLGHLFPLAIGNSVELELRETAEGGSWRESLDELWKLNITVEGLTSLKIAEKYYETFVIKTNATSKRGRQFDETQWYHPPAGLVLKSVRVWKGIDPDPSRTFAQPQVGTRAGSQQTYDLVSATFPPGAPNKLIENTGLPTTSSHETPDNTLQTATQAPPTAKATTPISIWNGIYDCREGKCPPDSYHVVNPEITITIRGGVVSGELKTLRTLGGPYLIRGQIDAKGNFVDVSISSKMDATALTGSIFTPILETSSGGQPFSFEGSQALTDLKQRLNELPRKLESQAREQQKREKSARDQLAASRHALEKEKKRIEDEKRRLEELRIKLEKERKQEQRKLQENKNIQEALKILDLYHGAIDGEIGLESKSSIKEWQRRSRLADTGELNSEQQKRLIGEASDQIKKIREERQRAELEKERLKQERQLKREAERKKADEEKKIALRRQKEELEAAKTEADILFSDIEAFAKSAQKDLKVLELLRLYYPAKKVLTEQSNEILDAYNALKSFSAGYPEFINFRELESKRRLKAEKDAIKAAQERLKEAQDFIYAFATQNVSSPATPRMLELGSVLSAVQNSDDNSTLREAEEQFIKSIKNEKLEPHLSLWKEKNRPETAKTVPPNVEKNRSNIQPTKAESQRKDISSLTQNTRCSAGTEFRSKNFRIKYAGTKLLNEIGANTFAPLKPSGGGLFVAVTWEYENISSKPISPNLFSHNFPTLKLKTENGTVLDRDDHATLSLISETERAEEKVTSALNPGIVIRTATAFEIAKKFFNLESDSLVFQADKEIVECRLTDK